MARALQGASAAVIYSVGLALVVDTFGVQHAGEKAGYALSSATFGVISGPLLGGTVYDHAGYNAVVGMMVGLVGVDIALRFVMIEKKTAKMWMEVAVVHKRAPTVQYPVGHGTNRFSNGTFGNPEPFLGVEPEADGSQDDSSQPASERDSLLQKSKGSSGKKRKIPPIFHLIREPRILADTYAVFVTYVLLASFDSDLGLFVKRLFGWESTGAGVIYLTIAMPSLLSPIAGYFSDKFGARWIAAGGFVANFVLITLLRLITRDTVPQVVAFAVEAMGRRRANLFGEAGAFAQAFALFNCAIAAGTVLGPLWTSWAEGALGWPNMNLCLAVFALTGAVIVASPAVAK
ncbi:MAG: hypothetical protein Q9172_005795 [Xanthocarpia lactea]